jgi:AcrR family transcriptional regulator
MRPALRELDATQSTDRRSVRTRSALRDALAAEIEETGDLSQVTVTAVSDRAGVTRRTFYSHYRDIADLVCQIEDETVRESRVLVRKIADTRLCELQDSISRFEPCPGGVELLTYFKERGTYLSALLGDGGDPGFAEKLTCVVRDAVRDRAAEGLVPLARGSFFEYYLTFAISAEVGVLVRWLTSGMHESVEVMAGIMTALMFVRPGDLYGRKIDFEIPAITVGDLATKGNPDD